MAPKRLFDTNTLWNFAAIDRLDVLTATYPDAAIWTDSVKVEVEKAARSVGPLRSLLDDGWLGTPLSFEDEELLKIEQIRSILKDLDDPPTRHVAEAECIFAMENRLGETLFVTDDGPAADLARRRGHRTMNTARVLSEAHAMAVVGCPEAWELIVAMEECGRGVTAPDSHTEIC